MKKFLFLAVFGTIALAAAPATFHPKIQVKKVADMDVNTAIDNPVWQSVPSYPFMRLVYNMGDMYRKPAEPATVQYLFDNNYFYVRAVLTDSDVMTTGTANGTHLYVQGDLLEVFIKPDKANYYWEIYGTPNQLQSRFYFGARATVGLPSGFAHKDVGIKVFSKVDGTLNDPTDRDKSCTTMVAIPISE